MSFTFQIPACAGNRRRENIWSIARSHVTSVTCDARNDLLFTMSDSTRAGALWGTDGRICFSHGRDCDRDDRRTGGARRDRTDDLLLAKQALSQLSYGPASTAPKQREWWAWEDLNFRPHAYQARALTN
jgi:hypothetical protein